MDIRYKNTIAFLSGYADRTISEIKQEMAVVRRRNYPPPTGTINTPINASGEASRSLEKKSIQNGLNIEGNSYIEKVDEGTRTENTTKKDILRWMTDKNIKVKDIKGKVLEQTQARRENLANLIVSKLLENGIRRTSFLTDIIDESNQRLTGIENSVAQDVEDNIEAILLKYGYKEKGNEFTIE